MRFRDPPRALSSISLFRPIYLASLLYPPVVTEKGREASSAGTCLAYNRAPPRDRMRATYAGTIRMRVRQSYIAMLFLSFSLSLTPLFCHCIFD